MNNQAKQNTGNIGNNKVSNYDTENVARAFTDFLQANGLVMDKFTKKNYSNALRMVTKGFSAPKILDLHATSRMYVDDIVEAVTLVENAYKSTLLAAPMRERSFLEYWHHVCNSMNIKPLLTIGNTKAMVIRDPDTPSGLSLVEV